MAYFSSFDVSKIGASTLTLSTSGESNIVLNIATMLSPESLGATPYNSVFNHVVSREWGGLGPFGNFTQPIYYASYSFLFSVQSYLRALATTATWTNPNSITLSLNTTTWHLTFAYSNSFTAINFGNTETRRLFGFSGNFSGSSASVTGSELPKYIIVPEIDGASSATPVFEEGSVSSVAHSGGGRSYSLSRSTTSRSREWVQQYETKVKTFRPFAAAAPNEFTYQHLFEHCRAGYPFGVYGGFGENVYEAYVFRSGAESFRANPATPGNADQFHVPFKAYALARL